MSHHDNQKSGFTIIELLVVLALILILTSVFVPRYTKLAILKPQVYSSAHDLAADLRYTRELALHGGVTGNSGKNYWLKLYKTGAATDTWKIFEDGSEAAPIKTVKLMPGIQMPDSSTDSFYFDTNGIPSPSTGGMITVQDEMNNYRWRVTVIKTTGRAVLIEN